MELKIFVQGLKTYEYYSPKPTIWFSWYICFGGSCIAIAGASVAVLRYLATFKPKKNYNFEDEDGDDADMNRAA